MDRVTFLPFPNASNEPLEHDLVEIDAAIVLGASAVTLGPRN